MAPKRRLSVSERMQGMMRDYEEDDIQEILTLLRADRRKIPRALRMIRGNDLLTDDVPGEEDDSGSDDLPPTCTKFGSISKAVLMEIVESLDNRFTKPFMAAQERKNPGTVWTIFAALTAFQKNYKIPTSHKQQLIDFLKEWRRRVGFAALPAPPLDNFALCKFAVYEFKEGEACTQGHVQGPLHVVCSLKFVLVLAAQSTPNLTKHLCYAECDRL